MPETVVRIKITGDIDSSNADELTDYVLRRAANPRRLIVDLQNVEFSAQQAFQVSALSPRCGHAVVVWTLVPSRAVSRVLEIRDPRSPLSAVTA